MFAIYFAPVYDFSPLLFHCKKLTLSRFLLSRLQSINHCCGPLGMACDECWPNYCLPFPSPKCQARGGGYGLAVTFPHLLHDSRSNRFHSKIRFIQIILVDYYNYMYTIQHIQ
jgi:hypothetical protein